MIKDKHNKPQTDEPIPPLDSVPEKVSENPFVNMYDAVRRAILTVREDPDDPTSPPLFKTIAIDNGQFTRLIRTVRIARRTASYIFTKGFSDTFSGTLSTGGVGSSVCGLLCLSFIISEILQKSYLQDR